VNSTKLDAAVAVVHRHLLENTHRVLSSTVALRQELIAVAADVDPEQSEAVVDHVVRTNAAYAPLLETKSETPPPNEVGTVVSNGPSVPDTVRATHALVERHPTRSPESIIWSLRSDGHDPIVVRDTLKRLSKKLGRRGKKLRPLADDLDAAIKKRLKIELRELLRGRPDLSRDGILNAVGYPFRSRAEALYESVLKRHNRERGLGESAGT